MVLPLLSEEFQLLADLAVQLLNEWTEHDLIRCLKITLDDPRLKTLFERGIVAYREQTARYFIAPGLREMTHAWTRLP